MNQLKFGSRLRSSYLTRTPHGIWTFTHSASTRLIGRYRKVSELPDWVIKSSHYNWITYRCFDSSATDACQISELKIIYCVIWGCKISKPCDCVTSFKSRKIITTWPQWTLLNCLVTWLKRSRRNPNWHHCFNIHETSPLNHSPGLSLGGACHNKCETVSNNIRIGGRVVTETYLSGSIFEDSFYWITFM